jgi:hypothetical protein
MAAVGWIALLVTTLGANEIGMFHASAENLSWHCTGSVHGRALEFSVHVGSSGVLVYGTEGIRCGMVDGIELSDVGQPSGMLHHKFLPRY